MQKSIHPLAALGILVFFGGLLFGWFWANQQLLELDRLRSIKISPDQELVVQLDRRLYFMDPDGRHLQKFDLADLGLGRFVGDYGFFANGDLLLSLAQEPLSLLEKMKIFLRLSAAERQSEDARLQRCSVETRRCRVFSEQLPDFYRSFRLHIDTQRQQVFIADTSREQLWLLDEEGQVLAKKDGFRFPNQVLVHQESLWLADTNHHQIKRLKASVDGFGEELQVWEAELGNKHRWPFALAPVGDEWWALLADSGMRDAILVAYNQDQLRNLPLPAKADPQALLVLPDRVLVADYRLFVIHQLDLDGRYLGNFAPDAMAEPLAELRSQARFWQFTGYAFIGIFVLALVVGFVFAIRQHQEDAEVQRAKMAREPKRHAAPLSELPTQGLWLEPSVNARVLLGIMCAGLAGAMVLLVYMARSTEMGMGFWFTLVALACCYLPLFALAKVFINYRLGIFDERVELIYAPGQKVTMGYDQIDWTDGRLKIDRHFIPLGNRGKQMGVFPLKPIKQHLLPRLHPERKVSELTMSLMQWRCASKASKALTLLGVLLCVVALVWLR